MKQPQKTNHEIASLIISDLVNLNIKNFCIGSGSRSAPLALALQNNQMAKTHIHYDERSLAFFALGLAKASKTPTCIITTSGSAVANLFPAVMEAYMDNVPLVVITCDRSFEDQDRGTNQTCNQQNFFGSYVHTFKSFPSPPHFFDQDVITSSVCYAAQSAISFSLPVHLNIPFSEPLISETKPLTFTHDIPKTLPTRTTLTQDSIDYLYDILSTTDKGLIVVGGNYEEEAASFILSLSEKLSFPILADPLSNLREKGASSTMITHYNQIIHHCGKTQQLNPDVILFLGGHIISKNILTWTKSLTDTHQILVTNKHRHIDPTLSLNTKIEMSITDFASKMNDVTKRKEPSSYLSLWKGYSLNISCSIEDYFEDSEKLYEPMTVTSLLPLVNEMPFTLFFGNSLPIRYCDNFLFPKKISNKVFGNRGVSGIDGNLSTAIGICKALQTPVVAIVGDATFLHDSGALSLLKNENVPLIIVVINNNGGGIFNFLPYSDKKELLENKISPETNLEIGSIAASYNIPYWKAESENDYYKMIKHQIEESSSGIIEVPSDKQENLKLHQGLDYAISKTLSKSLKKERFSYFTVPKKQKSFASTDS